MASTRAQSKKMMRSRWSHLPDDLMFKILFLIPAKEIYKAARHVCKPWYDVINSPAFIQAHHCLSNASLIVQKHYISYSDSVLVEFPGKNKSTVKRFEYNFPGKILDSCDGLVLMSNCNRLIHLSIANPVTRQLLTLPPPPPNYIFKENCSRLAHTPVSDKFKILTSANQRVHTCNVNKYMILTAGVDTSWRFVDTRHIRISLSLLASTFAGGFFYWVSRSTLVIMDSETEVVQEFRLGLPQEMRKEPRTVLAMGDSLCVIVGVSGLKWEVWKLMDYSRAGGWTKLYTIDMEDQRERLTSEHVKNPAIPKIWWNNGEWLVFEMCNGYERPLVYNVQSGENYLLNINDRLWVDYHQHVSSLYSWKT